MYRVIVPFFDLFDNNHSYLVGDIYPREGKEVGEKRIKELSTSANRRNAPLIKAVEEDGQNSPTVNAEKQPRKGKQRK